MAALRDVFGCHSVQAVDLEGEEMKVLKYRFLREGERVKKGDEWRAPPEIRNWRRVPPSGVGVAVPDPLSVGARQFRRLEQ